jgi:hypothetical protein
MYPWLLAAVPLLMARYEAQGLAVAIGVGYVISLAVTLFAAIRLYRKARPPEAADEPRMLATASPLQRGES